MSARNDLYVILPNVGNIKHKGNIISSQMLYTIYLIVNWFVLKSFKYIRIKGCVCVWLCFKLLNATSQVQAMSSLS